MSDTSCVREFGAAAATRVGTNLIVTPLELQEVTVMFVMFETTCLLSFDLPALITLTAQSLFVSPLKVCLGLPCLLSTGFLV